MENSTPVKKEYEEAIFKSRFMNSKVITALGGRTNQYGERRDIEAVLKSHMASTIVENVEETDKEVARGIALGIELGKPPFGKIGEEFLAEHISEYTNSGLGVALAKVMLAGLSGDRVDRIIKGVEDSLEERTNISEEAKAAKIAHVIYDGSNKYKDRRRFNEVSTVIFEKVLMASEASGKVESVESLKLITDMPSEKDLIVRNPKCKEELERAFSYYCESYTEIPEDFVTSLDGYSKENIVAYYVASMREQDLSKI